MESVYYYPKNQKLLTMFLYKQLIAPQNRIDKQARMFEQFQQQLNQSLQQIKQYLPAFNLQSEQIINKNQKLLINKFQKTGNFLTKFQNDIEILNNNKIRDVESIHRIRKDIELRKSRNQFLNMAYQMEQGFVYQMRQSLSNLQKTNQNASEITSKTIWSANETQVKIQKLERQNHENECRTKRNKDLGKLSSGIEIDKKSNRILIKISRSHHGYDTHETAIYEVMYSPLEDKFTTSHKTISGAVLEFNFHRNIKKLYDQVVLSHMDTVITD